MDFIVGLPLSAHKFNSIWVIIDQLTKSTHFIPVHTYYRAEKYAELYMACTCVCTMCPKPSFLIKDPSLSHVFGSSCMLPWGRI
jgi:hypothetical protein